MSQLLVFQVAPAAPTMAAWLRNLLAPGIVAARFESPPGLEVRPTGIWGGWSAPRTSAPDGRIALSSCVVLWTPRSIIASYLHESTHSLLHRIDGHSRGHDAAFFCLLATLLIRVDEATDHAHALVETLDLYDLQDRPEALLNEPDRGIGPCLTWSMTLAHELAGADLSAEDLAQEIVRRYSAWLFELSDKP